MKQIFLFAIAMMASSAALAKDKVVDRPAFSSGGASFRPCTVVLGKQATTIGFKVFSGGTWSLSADSHLNSEGKTYRMTKATVFKRAKGQVLSSEALDPSKHYTWEYDSVSAEFEPLDAKVKAFDFVEFEKSGFNTQGIRLDGKHYPFALGNPKPYPYAKDEPLQPITPQYGKARYTLDMYRHDGTKTRENTVMFGLNNRFSDDRFLGFTENSYEIEASSTYLAVVAAPYPFQQFHVLMVPGYETAIHVDETASIGSCAKIYKKPLPTERIIQFEGPLADLQQMTFDERWIYHDTFYNTPADSLWEALQGKVQQIEKNKAYSRRQKDYGRLWAESRYLMRYMECVKDGSATLQDSHAADLALLKDGRSFYLVGDATYLDYAHANHIGGVVTEWMEDYARAMNLAKRIRGMEAVPEAAFDTIPPIYRKELRAMNDSTRHAIERLREAAAEVKVMDTPDCTGEEFIATVVRENPGVVLFFDLWATWCGPCMSGIKAMEPLKSQWAGRPIRFVYVTNESSPANQWTKQIASMPGIHYRLPDAIWKAIPNLDGIPQYYIYDSQGKLFYEQTGFGGIDPLKEKIEEALSSQRP
ncbi:MAG: TlpA family protein disulfide reductase [Bacteroidaceae bacterium]